MVNPSKAKLIWFIPYTDSVIARNKHCPPGLYKTNLLILYKEKLLSVLRSVHIHKGNVSTT